jgi:hypothetical protein
VYTRVVRFTDVSSERMDSLKREIDERDGPPEGAPPVRLQILLDRSQGTAVVLQHFDNAEDMEAGGRVFSQMDPSETPGTRASVDTCELVAEIDAR